MSSLSLVCVSCLESMTRETSASGMPGLTSSSSTMPPSWYASFEHTFISKNEFISKLFDLITQRCWNLESDWSEGVKFSIITYTGTCIADGHVCRKNNVNKIIIIIIWYGVFCKETFWNESPVSVRVKVRCKAVKFFGLRGRGVYGFYKHILCVFSVCHVLPAAVLPHSEGRAECIKTRREIPLCQNGGVCLILVCLHDLL